MQIAWSQVFAFGLSSLLTLAAVAQVTSPTPSSFSSPTTSAPKLDLPSTQSVSRILPTEVVQSQSAKEQLAKPLPTIEYNLASDRPSAATNLPLSVERVDLSEEVIDMSAQHSKRASNRHPVVSRRNARPNARPNANQLFSVNMRIVPPLPTVHMRDSKNPFEGAGLDLSKPTMRNLVR